MGRWIICLACLAGCGGDGYVGQGEYPETQEAVTQDTQRAIGEQDMSSEAPPSGWEIIDGVWGTDMDRDETVSLTGQATIKMLSGGGGATIISPWIAVGGDRDLSLGPAQLGYSTFVRLKSSSATAGNNVTVTIHYYGRDRIIDSSSIIVNNVPTSASWDLFGEAYEYDTDIRWIRIEIEKSSASFDLWIDGVVVQKNPAMGLYYTVIGDGSQAIPTGTWTPVSTSPASPAWWTEEGLGVACTITVYPPGVYIITAQATFDDLLGQENAAIRVNWTDFNGNALTSVPTYSHASNNNAPLTVLTTFVAPLDRGTTISMDVWHDGADDRDIGQIQISAARISD